MRLVLDTCSIGIGPEPGGGLTLLISNVEGMGDNTLIIPVAKESAEALIEGAKQAMGPRIETAPATALHGLKGHS